MAISLNRTLFIGLGGTGVKTLIQTKKMFLENYGRNGEIPPMIRFLAFDTDQAELDWQNDLTSQEVYYMDTSHLEMYCHHNQQYLSTWLPKENWPHFYPSVHNTGQVRTNGRLAFMCHLPIIENRIRQTLQDISYSPRDEKWSDFYTIDSPINVNLVFSLCGGTGSGMFLDMAYLVRRLSKELNMRVKINAYAVMPGIFDQEIMQSIAKPRIFSNAYAAIKETDYLMNMVLHHNTVNINWNEDRFETSEPPFNRFMMVDNRNSDGVVFNRIKELASMLSLSLLMSASKLSQELDDMDCTALQGDLNIENKQAWISAIGACTIVDKNENVASVYRDKVINKIIRQMLQDKDVNQEALTWMNVAQIEEHDGDDVIDAIATTAISPVVLNEDSLDRKTAETRIDTALDNQKNQFIPSNEDFETAVNRKIEAVSAALDEKLKTMIDIEGRVKSADRLLDEIKNRIDRFFVPEMTQEMEDHRRAKEDAETQLASGKQSLTDFLSRIHMFGGAEKTAKVRNIKSAIDQIVLEELETKRRSYAITFYAQLSELIANYKNQIYSLIASLETIKEENEATYRSVMQKMNNINRNCEINLSVNEIGCLWVEEFPCDFEQISSMLPNRSFLLNTNTEELRNAFTSFSNDLPQMHSIMDRTIDDVLNEMSENDFTDVIRRTLNRVAPFLHVDGSPYQLTNGTKVGSYQFVAIGVPDEMHSRVTQNVKQWTARDMTQTIFSTGLNNQIVVYRYMLPVPAYAVTALNTMRLYYDREKTICSHIDAELQKRMTEEQFDIQPRKTEDCLDKNEE